MTGNIVTKISGPTPFSLLKSFHGASFFGLDEMYLFGPNIGKQLWGLINDNSQSKSDIKNPFFLKKYYRDLLGKKLLEVRSLTDTDAQDGVFLDMANHAGYGRAVNYIDFIVHAVPTVLVEALQLQVEDLKKKRVKEVEKKNKKSRKGKERAEQQQQQEEGENDIDAVVSCFERTKEALLCLSLICELSEQYSINQNDLPVIAECVQKWHSFLKEFVGRKSFTINEHYLQHVPYIINQLGLMRQYSTRALEKTIGQYKQKIKSKSKLSENATNAVKRRFVLSQEVWKLKEEKKKAGVEEVEEAAQFNIDSSLDDEYECDLLLSTMIKAYFVKNAIIFDEKHKVKVIKECHLPNGQTLKKKRGNNKLFVVYNDDNIMNIGIIDQMFKYQSSSFALVEVVGSLESDAEKRKYISTCSFSNNNAVSHSLVSLDDVLGHAIRIPSLLSEEKTFIRYKL